VIHAARQQSAVSILAKSLGDMVLHDSALSIEKSSVFFNGLIFSFANFSKFIFAPIVEINALPTKKLDSAFFGFHDLPVQRRLPGL
jgi:hypothetical protein